MANIYVRSTDGNNANNGSRWALAKATKGGAAAIAVGGDFVFVSHVHAETQNSAMTITWAGTLSNPVYVICVNDGAEPPTAVATTATVTTTGTNSIIIATSCYVYGISFFSGTGSSTANITLNSNNLHKQVYENCSFQIPNTSAGSTIVCGTAGGGNSSGLVELLNCTYKFASTGQHFIQGTGCALKIKGGSFVSGTSAITYIFNTHSDQSRYAPLTVESLDCSNLGSAVNLATTNQAGSSLCKFKHLKLPSSWSGNLGTFSAPGIRVEMDDSDSANTNYRMWDSDYSGDTKSEATVVKTSGASDGTTTISWKMVSSANTTYPYQALTSKVISTWIDTTGVGKTVTVEFVHDTNVAGGQGAGTARAFQNNECWMEVEYMGSATSPLGTIITTKPVDILTPAADITSSSVAWTTTGLTTPVKQKFVSASFTPQQKGYIQVRICLAKASKTIYVDPDLTVA